MNFNKFHSMVWFFSVCHVKMLLTEICISNLKSVPILKYLVVKTVVFF